uniref:Protein pelota homolog n=1 Tax=Denticeps clupeoides TaxID=299321 RepID=A0AAY3ZZ59_9TELE
MKLLHKDIEKDNAGQVTLVPDEAEDMWHTYNLLQVGDSLRASTIRKVQTESSTGSVGSSRVRTTLTLCVETIDFDSQACQLRVKGTNIQENQYVKARDPERELRPAREGSDCRDIIKAQRFQKGSVMCLKCNSLFQACTIL